MESFNAVFSRLRHSLGEREDVDKAAQSFRNTGNFIDYREEEVCCLGLSKFIASFEKV